MNEAQDKISRLLRWEAGETPGPWGLSLFPTNRCNQRCKICWQRWVESETGQVDYSEVPDRRLLELVDEAAELEVREWTISGGGEPMMRGHLMMALCERIQERGMYGHLHTNATMLTREHLEHLIRIRWRWLNVSLDGPNPEINDAIRSKGAFERATENIRRLAELRRKHRVDRPIVILNPVVTRANYDKMDQMVQLAKELECAGGVFLSSLIVHDQSSASFELTDDERAQLPERLARAVARAERLGVPNNIRTLLPSEPDPEAPDPHREESRFVGDGRLTDALCFEAWLNVAIAADGKAGPCCVFYDAEADSIRDMGLREVWVGPYLEGIRKKLLARSNLPSYCASCHSAIAPRTEDLRQALLARARVGWSEMDLPHRIAFLTRRFASSLRNHGLRQAVRRAREWTQLHGPQP